MATEIAKVPENAIIEIEKACADCGLAALQGMTPIRRTLALASGMQTIRRHLTGGLMANIMELANTPLGFLTDRKPGTKSKDGTETKPYPEGVIRDAVIEGMLRGASIIGNEINVIAGRCYLTRAYFERQLREWPGLSNLAVVEGVPVQPSGGRSVLVPMRATWNLNGEPNELRCELTSDGDFRIPVIANENMGADAVLGKARRKLFARIHARLCGSDAIADQADADEIEPAVEPSEVLPADIAAHLETLEQLTDVDAYQQSVADGLKEIVNLARLAEWCDWRRDAIRETRGPRTNK